MFPFFNVPAQTPAMQQIFNGLPTYVQESIRQSGIQFENEKQLSDFAAQFEKRK